MKNIIACLLLSFLLFIGVDSAHASTVGYLDTKENRTLVPIRFISESLGAEVTWNQQERTITIEQQGTTIVLTVGSKRALKNNAPLTVDKEPIVENGTTYVPLRFISEAFGITPEWQKETSTVLLQLPNEQLIIPVVDRTFERENHPRIQYKQQNVQVNGKTFKMNIVKIDLKHPNTKMDVVLANNKIGSVESLESMAKRSGATVAVNGTFFDAYTSSSFKRPYGFIYKDGEQLNFGDDRAVFWFDDKNHAFIYSGAYFKEFRSSGFVKGALQAGPTLVKKGQISLNPKEEGHSDPKILTSGGARSAIGIDRNQNLIIATTGNATIPELAHIMKQLGAYEAMNLDGGASSGLYYNGKYITTPGRLLSNALILK